ncbi:MAG: elongation factor 1-beta [Candidatus Anstonellales archaeon]
MGQVAVKLKIYPESINELEELKERLNSQLNPTSLYEEPIAFGMKALVITVIIPDSAGGSDLLEEKVKKINGVSQVQIEEASLI